MTTPGDIKTVPFDKLFYNAPFDDFQKVKIILTNMGVGRIGFHLKKVVVSPSRIEIDPANGCLDAGEKLVIGVSMRRRTTDGLYPEGLAEPPGVDASSDRVTIEWTDAPAGAPKKYNRDWFTGDSIVRRKNVAMQYNE